MQFSIYCWLFPNVTSTTYHFYFNKKNNLVIPCTSFADNTESPQLFSHLYEGDIKLTERQRLNDLVFGDPDGSPARAATNVDKIKWPNAVIPYEFDCSVGEFIKIYYI